MDVTVKNVIAGFLSTIDFTPSQEHPDKMLPWAEQTVVVVLSSLLASIRRS